VLHIVVIIRPAYDGKSADRVLGDFVSNLDATPHARVYLMEFPDKHSGIYAYAEASQRSTLHIPLTAGQPEDGFNTMALALDSLLSQNATHVAIVEGGLLMESSTWVDDTLKLLKQNVYEVVQLFGLLAEVDGALGTTRELSTSLGYDAVHRPCSTTPSVIHLEEEEHYVPAPRKALEAYAFDVKDAGRVRDYITPEGTTRRNQPAPTQANMQDLHRLGYVPGVARRLSSKNVDTR
jgi:hypothetical protein